MKKSYHSIAVPMVPAIRMRRRARRRDRSRLAAAPRSSSSRIPVVILSSTCSIVVFYLLSRTTAHRVRRMQTGISSPGGPDPPPHAQARGRARARAIPRPTRCRARPRSDRDVSKRDPPHRDRARIAGNVTSLRSTPSARAISLRELSKERPSTNCSSVHSKPNRSYSDTPS